MGPDLTTTVSLDYLVELTDDGNQPDQPETEEIMIPPLTANANGLPGTAATPAPDIK
jgi:hypothetical protein